MFNQAGNGAREINRRQTMKTADITYTLSTRQITAALNGGISYLMPWPAHIIGEYGSGTFDGSPVTPESCDRVMDAYATEALADQFPAGRMTMDHVNPDLVIHSIIAGRKNTKAGIVPCIVVRIGAEGQVTGFGREVWAHE